MRCRLHEVSGAVHELQNSSSSKPEHAGPEIPPYISGVEDPVVLKEYPEALLTPVI